MPALLILAVLAVGALQASGSQDPPRGRVFREPLYVSRPAQAVEPSRGLPLQFSNATLSLSPATLQTEVTSRTLRTVPISGILLRVAFGPTRYGMITFRMRPDRRPNATAAGVAQLTPNAGPHIVVFSTALEDRARGFLALQSNMRVLFTLERLEDNEGQLIFENPDATELLWDALGRPSLSDQ